MQWCCNIILLFQIRWGSRLNPGIQKGYLFLYYKNIVFKISVDSLPLSASSVATYLRLDGKFHTSTCTCAGSIDKTRRKHLRSSVLPCSYFKILSVSTNDWISTSGDRLAYLAEQIPMDLISGHYRYFSLSNVVLTKSFQNFKIVLRLCYLLNCVLT